MKYFDFFLNIQRIPNAYIKSQPSLCSSFRASLPLGLADGIPGPVIHQLVQVVSEGPLTLLGVRASRRGSSGLGQGRTLSLQVS